MGVTAAILIAATVAVGPSGDRPSDALEIDLEFDLPPAHRLAISGDDPCKPQVTELVEPGYTEEGLRRRVQGVVIVRAETDTEGRVTSTRILKPLPYGLAEAAEAAVRKWRLAAPVADGRAIPAAFVAVISFRLPTIDSLTWSMTHTETVDRWLRSLSQRFPDGACPVSLFGEVNLPSDTPEIEALFAARVTDRDELASWLSRVRVGRAAPPEAQRALWQRMLMSRFDCVRCYGADRLWEKSRHREMWQLKRIIASYEAIWREASPESQGNVVYLERDDRFVRASLSSKTLTQLRRERRRRRDRGPTVSCPVGEPVDALYFDVETRELVCELHSR